MILVLITVASLIAQNGLENRPEEIEAERLRSKWNEESVRQAIGLYLKLADEWQRSDTLNAARVLREAALLHSMSSEEADALSLLRRAIVLDRRGRNSGGEAETLSLIALGLRKAGDARGSHLQLAKAFDKVTTSKHSSSLARVLYSSAYIALYDQDFSKMTREFEKSLEIYQSLGNRKAEADLLREVAHSRSIANRPEQGRDFAERSVGIAREIGDVRIETLGLIALGDALRRMGRWEQAIDAFKKAESNFPPNLDLYEKAVLLNRIGFYHLTFGDQLRAESSFKESLGLFEKLNKTEGISELLSILGQIADEQGRYSEALDLFARSRSIARRSNDAVSLATLGLKIGESELALGRLQDAKESFRTSLAFYKKAGLDFRKAEVLEKLGHIDEVKGNFDSARRLYLEALSINQAVRSKFAQAENYFSLARLDNLKGDRDSALENIKRSVDLTESSRGETANRLLRRSFQSLVFDRYELYIDILMTRHRETSSRGPAVEALQVAERARARSLFEDLRMSSEFSLSEQPAADLIKEESDTSNLLNSKADSLTEALSDKSGSGVIQELEADIRLLEGRLEEIRTDIKRLNPMYSLLNEPSTFDVSDFQSSQLDEESILLEYSLGRSRSYLWVVSKDAVHAFVLPDRGQIEAKIEALRSLLNARGMLPDETIDSYQKRVTAADAAYATAASLLSEDLLGEARDLIHGKRLIVVADGKLQTFPLGAIPVPGQQSDRSVMLDSEIVYAPSASVLAIIMNRRTQPRESNKVLVFADAVFSKDDPRIISQDESQAARTIPSLFGTFRSADSLDSLPRLLASEEEAASISSAAGSTITMIRSGFSANRDALATDYHGYKVLHFATHGLIDENRPELSGILLSLYDESGNRRDRGFLRLQDVYEMQLSDQLVVLSACDTGLGKQIRGEGLMSLNNAFLQAGARSVVSSLWKVEDQATRQLMSDFYHGLISENLTPPAALRKAQIKLQEDPRFRSPFFWAAFTAHGDFKETPQFDRNGIGSTYWIAGAGLLLLALAGYFFRRRTRSLANNKS